MAAVPALHGSNYGTWMQEFSGNSSIDLLQTPQTSEFDLFLNDGPLQSTPLNCCHVADCHLVCRTAARLADDVVAYRGAASGACNAGGRSSRCSRTGAAIAGSHDAIQAAA